MNDTLTTRALDREASARRERLASTLDELSASLTPGRVLDEVLSYAKGKYCPMPKAGAATF